MSKFALVGDRSGKHLTWNGKVITHTNRNELEFLIPKGAKVVPIRINPLEEIPIQFVPGFEQITFPLRREDFR